MLSIFTTWLVLSHATLTNLPKPIITAEGQFRSEVIAYGQQYLGLPYVYASSTPEKGGFDCSGFTSYVFAHFNISLSRSACMQAPQCQSIKKEEAQPGDLIFFRRSSRSRIHHVAMVYSNDDTGIQIIHSCSSRGITIESLEKSAYWMKKNISMGRIISEDAILAYRKFQASNTTPLLAVALPAPIQVQAPTIQIPALTSLLSAKLYATPLENTLSDVPTPQAKIELEKIDNICIDEVKPDVDQR
jgi:hypothetical protein